MRIKNLSIIITILIFCGFATIYSLDKPQSSSVLDNLATLKNYQSKRISSFDKSGKNADRLVIDAGETAEIALIKGADNYVFAEIEGKGHFIGVNYYVDSPSPIWYGEGNEKREKK